jgi:hypothetical protein
MVVSRSRIEEGINWHTSLENGFLLSFPIKTCQDFHLKMSSNLLILRGENDGNQDVSPFLGTKYPVWSSSGFRLWKQSHPYSAYEKTATLLRLTSN